MLDLFKSNSGGNFLLVAVLSFCLDLLIGDPYWFPHPVIFMGRLVAYLEKTFRKILSKPSIATDLDNINGIDKYRYKPYGYSNNQVKNRSRWMKASGLAIWIIVVGTSSLLAYIWFYIFDFNMYLSLLMSTIALSTCLSTRCLAAEAGKIYKALDKGDIDLARKQLSYIVGRDTGNLDQADIIRATVETVAENTVDGTLAPMFYYFLGGLGMAFAYKAVNTMDSMLGYKNEKYRDIGFFPARLDDLFNYIPARLSLIFFIVGSIFLGYDFRACMMIGIRDRKNHTSPNCAYPEGAVAGALGIRLGGTNVYFGQEVYKPSIGDANRPLDKEDIIKANRLLYASSLVGLLFFLLVYILFRHLLRNIVV